MRNILFAAALLCTSMAAHADIAGDTIHVTNDFGSPTTVVNDLGNITVPETVYLNALIEISVTGSSVTFTAYQGFTSANFDPGAFNGFELEDLTKSPGVSGFSLVGNPAGGFTVDDAFTNGNTLYFNFAGHELVYGDPVTYDFVSRSAPSSVTPEPSSVALLGTGLLGVAGVVRKRFT